MTTDVWFSKLASIRSKYGHGDLLAYQGTALTRPEATDTLDVAAVKTAAGMMDILRLIGNSSNSHLLGTALYAPLVAADWQEARHQRAAGKSGWLPALAGGALAVMMAQHAAPMLQHAVKTPAVQKLLTRIGVGAK